MRIAELLTELSFMGRTCTKDCSGHQAGYEYGLRNGLKAPTNTASKSFDSGTDLAVIGLKSKKVTPKPQPPEEEENTGPNATI